MNTKTLLLGAAATLMTATAANAGHFNGWYVGLEAGANSIDDVDVAVDLPGEPVTTGTASFDNGWAVLATAGYAFTNDWRLEAELGYRQNETTSGTAQVDEWSLMVNALYDIDVSHSWGLTLGVGAGYDSANFDVLGLADEDDGNFAYQGIAGLNFAVGSRTDLTLTYRYLRISEPEFEFGTPPASATFAFDDVTKHTLTLGLRYDLYPDAVPPPPAPPAPPPPPPPPPPANFVIFFGFGKCNITPEADAVLSEAAAAAKSRGSASVQIVGHTDSVGSAKANQKLSECRADAAKANLVGKGVADGAISTSGKGEGELLVQTGDNVKEPQNRRATVDLR